MRFIIDAVKRNEWYFIGLVMTLCVFWPWWGSGQIIGGDWPYFHDEAFREYEFPPSVWSTNRGNGFGGTALVPGLDTYLSAQIVLLVNTLGWSWPFVSRLFWFIPFVVLSYTGGFILSDRAVQGRNFSGLIGGVIFATNTYALMITTGGQMGVALAYALLPFVILAVLWISDTPTHAGRPTRYRLLSLKKSAIFGLAFGVQLLWDFRIAFLSGVAILVYGFFRTVHPERRAFLRPAFLIGAGTLVAIILNAFWILPIVAGGGAAELGQVDRSYTESAALAFFSFADFSHAASLLHPNWPENVFGMVHFFRPEYLALPLIAYGSLWLRKSGTLNTRVRSASKRNSIAPVKDYVGREVVCYIWIALVGTFLAKGTNDPFGFVNRWLFETVPGFFLFRDPVKWYMLVAVSFAVLIPYSLNAISDTFRRKNMVLTIVPFGFVLGWVLLILPIYSGARGGTFHSHSVPAEYVQLATDISRDTDFYRTLWVPRQSRFVFNSTQHPAISGGAYLNATGAAEFGDQFRMPGVEERLREDSVRFVVVPLDPLGEMFLTDRQFDQNLRDRYVQTLDSIAYLRRVDKYGDLAVYEMSGYRQDIRFAGSGSLTVISRTASSVTFDLVNPSGGTIETSYPYDPNRLLKLPDGRSVRMYPGSPTGQSVLPLDGGGRFVWYYPTPLIHAIGRTISIIALVGIMTFLLI